jgi:Tol biopolymer transport system component
MWTELLEGSTLEELIRQHGGANWREAAIYGIALCRALSAVHAIGFVHRDVKASNVMRERGGRIVLMDFGSASRYLGAADAAHSSVQGTPLAMAPEMLRGEPPSPAADIYSLGVLLFRVVAARYPLEAASLDELRAALDRGPLPSLRTVCPGVPLAFAGVLERALERDPAARVASAGEMERLLAEALSSDWEQPTTATVAAAEGGNVGGRRWLGRATAWVAAAVVVVAALAGITWFRRTPAPSSARPMQFTLQLPAGEHLPQFANVVVSPDGSQIVFASTDTLGRSALWLRRFDALVSQRIPGTEGARYPFWSPDSREVAFFSDSQLVRVSADGGPAHVVCDVSLGRGGSWSRSGTIVFAASSLGGLMRVEAEGGTPVTATIPDTVNSERSHRWPFFLPDGDHFLYVTTPPRDGGYGLYVGSLRSDRRVFVTRLEGAAVYSSGLLVYMANQGLEARPFNLRTLRWDGEPRPISAMPGIGGSPAEPHASVSQTGTLVYTFSAARESRLAWIDTRTQKTTTLAIGPYFDPALSPDGRWVAAERVEGTGRSNIWMIDAKTGEAARWTNDPALNNSPRWSPKGDSILFASNRTGGSAFYMRATDGSLAERMAYGPPGALIMFVNDWRPGGLISFARYEPGTGYNVYELRQGKPVAIACTNALETRSGLSPDGRWLAYESNATGRPRIYVLDRRTQERFMLPAETGMEAHWSTGTGHLYFRSPAGEFFAATPVDGKQPPAWPIRRLIRSGVVSGFAVDAKGERLLVALRNDLDRPEEVAVLVNMPQAISEAQ